MTIKKRPKFEKVKILGTEKVLKTQKCKIFKFAGSKSEKSHGWALKRSLKVFFFCYKIHQKEFSTDSFVKKI